MTGPTSIDDLGKFDASYAAFLATVAALRPRLHRYCSRMTGSVMDGEDVVQEVLFDAYRRRDTVADGREFAPWLFRIAHNRCIDHLRQQRARRARESIEAAAHGAPWTLPTEPTGLGVDRALERLVIHLPPKERACVLLKDVLDYTLEEISTIVDSTIGGVKAALHRGRAKLTALAPDADPASASPPADPELLRILRLYVELFNRHDWPALRELVRADARLRITDLYAGAMAEEYFTTFERLPFPWRLSLGRVEGVPVVLLVSRQTGAATAVVRLDVADGHVVRVRHYTRCPWVTDVAELDDDGAA